MIDFKPILDAIGRVEKSIKTVAIAILVVAAAVLLCQPVSMALSNLFARHEVLPPSTPSVPSSSEPVSSSSSSAEEALPSSAPSSEEISSSEPIDDSSSSAPSEESAAPSASSEEPPTDFSSESCTLPDLVYVNGYCLLLPEDQ